MNPGHNAMLTSYLEIARRSWKDEGFKQHLSDSPREALAEHGWELPEDTSVTVRFSDPEGAEVFSAEQLVAAWEREIADGRLRLLVPDQAPRGLETTELSDEQLAAAAGGADSGCGCCITMMP